MKHFMKILALCLSTMSLFLCGCQQQPVPTTVPIQTSSQPQLTPTEQYLQGREYIDSASNWILKYTVEQKRSIGDDTYTETVSGTASFSKLNQPDMTAVVEEKLELGGYDCAYCEVYCEKMAYVQVNNSSFKAKMDPQTFAARHLPAVLLDSSLYQTVTLSKMENSTVISFCDPSGLEKWLDTGNGSLKSASGTAVLDSSGVLRQTTYRAVYADGKVTYEISASVNVTAPQVLELGGTHQEHIHGSVELTDLDAPKMLLRVVGGVYSAGYIRCEAVESIFSEAIPLSYTQNSLLTLSGEGDTLSARAEHSVSMSDYRGEAVSTSWIETFVDGRFSTTGNGAVPDTVTAEQMRQYFEDLILSALAAPIYLRDADVVDEGTVYRLEITGNDAFIADMMANIGQFLRVDLDKQATQSKTLSASGYLTVNKRTGLPETMGLYLEREHVIESVAYQLTYRLEHTMSLSES